MTKTAVLSFLSVACCILATSQLLAMRASRTFSSSSEEIRSYGGGFWGRHGCDFFRFWGYGCRPVKTWSTTVFQSTLGTTRTSPSGQTRVTNGGGPLTTRTSDGAQTVISTTHTGVFQSSTPMGPCGQAQALAATAAATVNNAATESLAEISLAAGGLSKNDAIVSDATSKIAAAVQDAQTAMDSAVATAETACMAAGNDQTAINAANAAAVTSINAAQAAVVTSITATRDAAVTAIRVRDDSSPGRFITWDDSSPGTIHHLGRFITWDDSSPGRFITWDDSSPGRFITWDDSSPIEKKANFLQNNAFKGTFSYFFIGMPS